MCVTLSSSWNPTSRTQGQNAFECLTEAVRDASRSGHRPAIAAALDSWSRIDDASLDVSDWNPDEAAEGLMAIELLERRLLAVKASSLPVFAQVAAPQHGSSNSLAYEDPMRTN